MSKTPQAKSCFVVAPLGEAESTVRRRSDKILRHLIRPVCEDAGYSAQRADEVAAPSLITKRVISSLLKADLVIADLTGMNPNVFYEVAIRHATGKPIIQILELGEKLPFDIFDVRTIRVDHNDLDSVENCKRQLREFVRHCESVETIDNPILDVIRSEGFTHVGPRVAQADLVSQFRELSERMLRELAEMKADRALLITNIISGQTVKSPATGPGIDVSGKWASKEGEVILTQSGQTFVGEYCYGTEEFIGDLLGEVVERTLAFRWRWKDGTVSGTGFFNLLDDKLEGGWYGNSDYEKLLLEIRQSKSPFQNHTGTLIEWKLRRCKTVN